MTWGAVAFLEQIVAKLSASSPLRRGAMCGNVWFLRAGDIWAYLFLNKFVGVLEAS